MKQMKLLSLLAWASLLSITFIACSDDNDDEGDTNPTGNVVLVNYDIMEPATWYADSVYIIKKEVKIDATLTIQAGTVIKFEAETGLEVWGNGSINANGTSTEMIVFTSYKDDSKAGDNNGDGGQSEPNKGDWTNVDLASSSGSVFHYCYFAFGGDDAYAGVLDLGTNSSSVTNCTFAHNDAYVAGGSFWGSLYAGTAHKSTIIKDNIFYDNTLPITIGMELSIDNSNTFEVADEDKNTYNGIFVTGQDIEANVSWLETEVAFVIEDTFFEVWDGFTLTLGNNVVIKFPTNGSLDLHTASQLSNGQGNGVYFTSFKDDSKKGDSNGDGNASTPSATDWCGIYDRNLEVYYTWSNILYSKNED